MLKDVCNIVPLFLKVYEILHGSFLSYEFLYNILNHKMLFCYPIDRSYALALLALQFSSLLYPIFKYYDFFKLPLLISYFPCSSYITRS